MNNDKSSALILGFWICFGLMFLGLALGSSLIRFKKLDRFVVVKG